MGWRGRGSCGALAFHTGVLAFHSARRPRSSAHRRRMRPSALCSMLLFAPLVSQLQPRDPHGAHASHRHQRRRHRCASGDGDGFTRWYPSVRSGTPSGRARPGTDQPLPLHTPLSYLSRHRNRQASEPQACAVCLGGHFRRGVRPGVNSCGTRCGKQGGQSCGHLALRRPLSRQRQGAPRAGLPQAYPRLGQSASSRKFPVHRAKFSSQAARPTEIR